MDLGSFSLSLNVKNIHESMGFYQALGFSIADGGHMNEGFPDTKEKKWRIMENESLKVGLFQGMFDGNIMSFYPQNVLDIQEKVKKMGLNIKQESDSKSTDHSSLVLEDPDGNKIVMDQY